MVDIKTKREELGGKLLNALKKSVEDLIEDRKKKLIEDNRYDYLMGYDKDFVDVGVGSVCVRCDEIFDEERALDDAEEEIINDIERNDNDVFYYLVEDDDFRNALVAFLRGTE